MSYKEFVWNGHADIIHTDTIKRQFETYLASYVSV